MSLRKKPKRKIKNRLEHEANFAPQEHERGLKGVYKSKNNM